MSGSCASSGSLSPVKSMMILADALGCRTSYVGHAVITTARMRVIGGSMSSGHYRIPRGRESACVTDDELHAKSTIIRVPVICKASRIEPGTRIRGEYDEDGCADPDVPDATVSTLSMRVRLRSLCEGGTTTYAGGVDRTMRDGRRQECATVSSRDADGRRRRMRLDEDRGCGSDRCPHASDRPSMGA